MKTIFAALGGALVVTLLIAAVHVWQFMRRPVGEKVVHRPKISSLNPFGSGWDFMTFSSVILVFSAMSAGGVLAGLVPADVARCVFLGAVMGSDCTLASVIPFEVSVPVSLRGRFYERLAQLRYVEQVADSGVFVLDAPRFARWDSNRVTVTQSTGRLKVILPLICLSKI